MTIPVAAPQWRIDDDREQAALTALAAGADQLHLDFGGGFRGPRLDSRGQLRTAADIARTIATPALAVHCADDLGLVGTAASALVEAALAVALELGFRVLHVPDSTTGAHSSPDRLAEVRAILARVCERADGRLVIAYESALGAEDSVALVRGVGHPALRIVLDTGGLAEAGHNPAEFAATTRLAGVLHSDVHVSAPRNTATDGFAMLPDLASRGLIGSVLVKNDYRDDPGSLESDIRRCRISGPRRSKTVRLPH